MNKAKISGYMCVLGGIIGTFVNAGVYRSNSLIYEIMLQKFGASNTVTAWIFSTHELFGFGFTWITATLCARFGCRKTVIAGGLIKALGTLLCAFPPSILYMYFTYGVVCALGTTFSWDPLYIILTYHFQKQKGRATGIATSGGSLGGIVMAPLIQYLYEKYAYSGTMLILAGITLHLCVSGALFSPPQKKEIQEDIEVVFRSNMSLNGTFTDTKNNFKLSAAENKLSEDDKEKQTDNKSQKKRFSTKLKTVCGFWKNKLFVGYIISICCFMYGFISCMTFMAGLAGQKSISKMQSALILSISGVIDVFTRPLAGVIYDIKIIRDKRAVVYCLITLLLALCIATLPLTFNFTTFMVNWVFFTIFTTSSLSQYYTVMGDLVSKEVLPHAMGFTGLCMGVGATVGPVIGGAIRDVTGQYDLVYYCAALVMFMGNLLFFMFYLCFKSNPDNRDHRMVND